MGKQAFRLPGTLLRSAYAQLTGEKAGALAEQIEQEDGTCKRQEQSEPHAIGKTEPPPFQYIVKTVPPASVSSVESESSRPP